MSTISEQPKRLEEVAFSKIRAVMDKAVAMRAKGIEVIALSAGEPNFNTPSPIKEATIRAIEENYTHYGSNRGLPKLREILAKQIYERDHVSYDPETEILCTTGGAEALNNVILGTVNEGDEVIILSPAFVTYKNLVYMCQATPVELPLKMSEGFQLNIADIEAAITEKTKMIIMNNPNNPSGAVYAREDLEKLCDLAKKYDLLILSDEMYSALVYEGEFVSVASFPGMKERAIIVSGFSKTYAMTGWRLGYIQAEKTILTNILKVHQYSSTCSPTFIQVGLANSIELEQTQKEVQDMIDAFSYRRNLIIAELEKVPKITYVKPQGAFYVMVDVSATGMNGEDFAAAFLEKKHVATVPAASLGKDDLCADYIRLSFAASEENIVEAVKRLKEFIEEM